MDIEQDGVPVERDDKQIILPGEGLPGLLYILPHDQRPLFPGQALPLVLGATQWLPTLEAMRERGHDVIGLLGMPGSVEDGIDTNRLYTMGTACRIHRVHRDGEVLHLLLEGLQRFRVRQWSRTEPPLLASVQYFPDRTDKPAAEQTAYAVAIINIIKELIPLNPLYGEELKIFLGRSSPNRPAVLADFAASMTTASREVLQDVLETVELDKRLQKVVELLHKELKIAAAQQEIREHVEKEIQSHQREQVLRQQLKYIQKELGLAKDDKTAQLEQFRERAATLQFAPAARKRFDEEMEKLAMLDPSAAEWNVTRNYLDWLTSLPWGVTTRDATDLATAAKVLARHHEGLDDVRDRILEFLALGVSRGNAAGSIICLVGPPGVGKTSLGRAIAEALNRQFFRFSVGGMRDEAEIKGHRRTYIGALPGKLLQALKDCGTQNPVIMLDEIDKIGASYQGDPAAALLEVLDPEQNSTFRDHYLDVDFDLSKVLFVCTANQLDTIPAPLLDRMEVIHLSGYLDSEKLAIARKHLWPRQVLKSGRKRTDIRLDAAALREVVEHYAREAGVRQLEKHLARIVRKANVSLVNGSNAPIVVHKADIARYLGPRLFENERLERGVGIVTGLAWTAMGGATLPVEATLVHRNGAGLKLTGQLGNVMQESANIAYSYVRSAARQLGLDPAWFDDATIHLHVPAGATPKDGPSAGITMATALVSLASGRQAPARLAMTGELTLSGQVYPVGGIREKLLAAKRQGIKRVILPAANERDAVEVPAAVKAGIDIHYARDYRDVQRLVFIP
ncbi:MAG: endopeptidase La [Pseudomonadales bacterium]